jgi:hypothetical protein
VAKTRNWQPDCPFGLFEHRHARVPPDAAASALVEGAPESRPQLFGSQDGVREPLQL